MSTAIFDEGNDGELLPSPFLAASSVSLSGLHRLQIRLQSAKGLQSPLHWICAHDVLETGTGECLGGGDGWAKSSCRHSCQNLQATQITHAERLFSTLRPNDF